MQVCILYTPIYYEKLISIYNCYIIQYIVFYMFGTQKNSKCQNFQKIITHQEGTQ